VDFLRKIAFPISLIYATVVHVRNFLYDVNIFKSKTFSTPTISVGNLSVGGTGKTPMIEYLISHLSKEYKTAVLSRGYRRKSNGFVLASASSNVEELGDEPYQIHSKFSEVAVAVDTDRRNGIAQLEAKVSPDLILLDDAYQHRKVLPTVSILLTSYFDLYCDDWYLPTGNLRDSKKEAKRANIIVVTKCPEELSNSEQSEIIKKLKPQTDQEVLFSYLVYSEVYSESKTRLEIAALKKEKITLVTGIANPEPLVLHLKNNGHSFEHFRFRDHHFFNNEELKTLNSKEFILTTEKDFVRLKGKVDNLHYISIKHAFMNEGKLALNRKLSNLIKQYR